MTIDTVEKLDEMRARAMAEQDSGPHGSALFGIHWEEFGDGYLSLARAVREADEREGLLTVPVEPTDEMLGAWYGAAQSWVREEIDDAEPFRAMIAASPFDRKVMK